jgi:4-alpha-glucanotransferase
MLLEHAIHLRNGGLTAEEAEQAFDTAMNLAGPRRARVAAGLLELWADYAEAAKPGKGAKARKEMREILDFCRHPEIPVPCAYTPEVHSAFIHGLFACNSWLVVHQITDIIGSSDRFNVPGAIGSANWTARIENPVSEWNAHHAALLSGWREAVARCGRA